MTAGIALIEESAPPDIAVVEASLGYDIHPRMALVLLGAATAVGAIARVAPFAGHAFPLNEGGLVYELVRSLLAHGFAVPFDVNYNGLDIPFAYPPVAIFLIGFVAGGFHIPIPYAQTLVAVAASILTVPVVYLLARHIVSTRQTAVGAAFAYALMPHAFDWLVTGSGAPRAIALLFMVLALQQALLTIDRGSWVSAVNTGVLSGLTLLTLPRAAFLLLLSIVVLAAFRARRPRLLSLGLLALLAAALTSWAWLDVVISKHGLAAVMSAIIAGIDPGTSLRTLLSFDLSGAPILDVLSILGVVGGVALLLERKALLPAWFLVLFMVDERAGTSYAMVPFSLMASHAATEIVVRWPAVLHLSGRRLRLDHVTAIVLAGVLFLAALLGSLTAPVSAHTPLRGVGDDGLTAMVWIRDNLNPGSRFVVMSPDPWETDAYGSWLPAISRMQNVASVQGYEWLGLDASAAQQLRHDEIQACVPHTIDCVESWIQREAITIDYVLIPKPAPTEPDCCPAARESMRISHDFHVVYDGPGATVGALLGRGVATDPVLVGAGDIAACDSSGAASTAALIERIPGTVFTVGDNAYETGSPEEFASCYDPTWGRFKDRTRPAPGNHDYYSANAAPYYAYFASAAGNPNEGWYSYAVGTWHVIVLNSDCAAVGGCGPGSRQLSWLSGDLRSHPADCTLAIWHHPLFTAGSEGPTLATADFWRVLYRAGADVILNGHDHDYQRFSPLTPDGKPDPARGIREFVVGTGGRNLLAFQGTAPYTEARQNTTYGVLKLTLHAGSYDWRFVPVVTGAFTDSGSGVCH